MRTNSLSTSPATCIRISVCMATYNGAKYLQEQVASILEQLGPHDELVVVDDDSRDETVEMLRQFADPRIVVYPNDRNRGHVYSFSRVLSLARNDLIVMTDQDDIWIEGRLERMKRALLDSGRLLVSSNSAFIDSTGQPTGYDCEGVRAELSARHVANIVSIFVGRRRYYGCAMAMHRRLNDLILPMPAYVESHDLWIAVAANMAGSNLHMEENTLLRRLHGHNASVLKRPLRAKLWSRVIFLLSFIDIAARIARNALRPPRATHTTTR